LPRYQHEQDINGQKQEAVRLALIGHDMKQGFVLTQYFYEQMIQFEKDPASLKDDIGEMVYGMDIEQQVHRARQTEFDKEADFEVLGRSKPRKLAGMDLAESELSKGDIAGASAMAQKVLTRQSDTIASTADSARAWFILARAAAMTGHPEQAIEDFQKTLATSKEQRLLAWSHIYLGRMLDLDCKRDEAMSEYKLALTVRDGREDTRLAAERGVKNAYSVNGHTCDEDADEVSPSPVPPGKTATGPHWFASLKVALNQILEVSFVRNLRTNPCWRSCIECHESRRTWKPLKQNWKPHWDMCSESLNCWCAP
jgi:tetratricopeptide (TPR) repeat protein